MYDDGKETLVLQSKFSAAGKPATDAVLGWVVPVPAVPELDSMDSISARSLFYRLDRLSQPSVTAIPIILLICLFVWLLVTVALILYSRYLVKTLNVRPFFLVILSLLLLLIVVMIPPTLLGRSGVEVLAESDVGIYQTKVIKGGDSSALLDWLKEGGFQFHASDQPVLDDYIKRGWVFVVAKVRPGEKQKALDSAEGMPDPLILRFDSKVPVYPLALTGTTGTATEILLYVLGRSKWHCRDGMNLLFAGQESHWLLEDYFHENPKAFKPWEQHLPYLCKFKGTLTPDQMRKDLDLEPAADDAPYREHRVVWGW
jgi:hypothetical protein